MLLEIEVIVVVGGLMHNPAVAALAPRAVVASVARVADIGATDTVITAIANGVTVSTAISHTITALVHGTPPLPAIPIYVPASLTRIVVTPPIPLEIPPSLRGVPCLFPRIAGNRLLRYLGVNQQGVHRHHGCHHECYCDPQNDALQCPLFQSHHWSTLRLWETPYPQKAQSHLPS